MRPGEGGGGGGGLEAYLANSGRKDTVEGKVMLLGWLARYRVGHAHLQRTSHQVTCAWHQQSEPAQALQTICQALHAMKFSMCA